MDWTLLLWIPAVSLVLLGIAGLVLPVLPGPILVFAGMVCGAAADGFQRVGWVTLGALLLLAAAGYSLDLVASALGARRQGASRMAVVGATLGALVGLFFGLPGLVLGPFLGAVAGEYTVRRDLRQAGRVGLGTWLGLLLAGAGRVAVVFVMLGVFAGAYALW